MKLSKALILVADQSVWTTVHHVLRVRADLVIAAVVAEAEASVVAVAEEVVEVASAAAVADSEIVAVAVEVAVAVVVAQIVVVLATSLARRSPSRKRMAPMAKRLGAKTPQTKARRLGRRRSYRPKTSSVELQRLLIRGLSLKSSEATHVTKIQP